MTMMMFRPTEVASRHRPAPAGRATTRAAALLLACLVAAVGPGALRAADPDLPYHGVAVQLHPTADPVAAYAPLIAEVADLGANTVLLSANGYQKDIDSIMIDAYPDGSPTDRQWMSLFDTARRHGLRIVLMPKILLSDPRDGAWRGKIAPVSWTTWFDQYRRFMLYYAELARRGSVEVLLVGSELVTTEKHTDQWRRIIREVRAVYPGKLAYSANWDHYKGIQFWGDLDLIGLTTYYNLNEAEKDEPSTEDLKAAWRPIRDDILNWRKRIGRPLLFTEVGWCSQEGASIAAWNYYHNEKATPAGHREQHNNYRAFVEIWADRPEVGGILWWEWTSAPGGPHDHSYSPRGKPAEGALREFFDRAARRSNRPGAKSQATRPADPPRPAAT